MKNKPILMLCYARSGGTLLNRYLASLPKVIMFSEINPEATWLTKNNTISKQSKLWYNIKIKESSFIEEVKQITKICINKNSHLIIRDFSYGSFVPRSYNSFNPSHKLLTLETLIKANIDIKPFAFVRNTEDIWLSMNASKKTFHDRELKNLYEFTKLLIENKIKIFKYEDFCNDPETEIKNICKYVKIPYSSCFKKITLSFKVTGDINTPTFSRGVKEKRVVLLPKRTVSKKIAGEIDKNIMIKKINDMLGYIN